MDICRYCKKETASLTIHERWCKIEYDFLKEFNLNRDDVQNKVNLLGSKSKFKEKYYKEGFDYSNFFKRLNVKNPQKMHCSICGEVFENKNPATSLQKHSIRCVQIKDFMEKYKLTSSKLQEEYNILGSVIEFKEKYPYSDKLLWYYNLFTFYNIEVSVKFSSNHKKNKKKHEDTCIKKYGARHNFCKESESRKKWQKRLLEEEGITTVFQRESVKEKINETLVLKYGTIMGGKVSKEYHRGSPITSIHKQVIEILYSENIPFSIEFLLKETDETTHRKYYKYDILIENTKKLIEVNGDMWHANPLIYKSTDIINIFGIDIKCEDIWNKDFYKKRCAESYGFTVLSVWENDLKHNLERITKEILNYAKNKDTSNNKDSKTG